MRRSRELTDLARARVWARMPQKEMADILGIGVRHLRFIESGERKSEKLVKKAMEILSARI